MLFNSFQFFLFFPVVTFLYFALPHRFRWMLLLSVSCYFYMTFIPVYILILMFTIAVDYVSGIMIENAAGKKSKRSFLIASIVANVGVLAVFKYFNFVNGNLISLTQLFHWNYPIENLSIILPIGLSFHTFQAMSYTIEVYRGRQKAERHLGIYALYVMFYPQLVAGPIERPQNLIHQFYEKHEFDYIRVTNGFKLMCWGLFKKVVIADRIAPLVDQIYNHPQDYQGVAFAVATILFAFQIFCDFSGYSDIAIGAARVMGFTLMKNFDQPYSSKSISEFWQRWHISLSSWFRDYLYIPLGGNRVSKWRWQFNLFVVFLVSGLWHGASWTFVVWGALHGFYMIASMWTQRFCSRMTFATRIAKFPRVYGFVQMVITFILVCFAWIFFRAHTTADALYIVSHLFTGWQQISFNSLGLRLPRDELIIVLVMIVVMEFVHVLQQRGSITQMLSAKPIWLRWTVYVSIITVILVFGKIYAEPSQFIYFQF